MNPSVHTENSCYLRTACFVARVIFSKTTTAIEIKLLLRLRATNTYQHTAISLGSNHHKTACRVLYPQPTKLIPPKGANQFTPNSLPGLLSKSYTEEYIAFFHLLVIKMHDNVTAKIAQYSMH